MKKYRSLTDTEISELEAKFCCSKDWTLIRVSEDFSTENIYSVQFSGKVTLGSFKHSFELECGVKKQSGIYNAHIHNCTIEDNVYISNVKTHIANYHIKEKAFIENVGTIETVGKSSFGNGTKVAVLDETGSREVTIFDKITAQLAYILTTCKYSPLASESLNKQIADYIRNKESNIGTIEANANITNSNLIKNVYVGESANISGIDFLENGTIYSSNAAPTEVLNGVIARDFILGTGVSISDKAQLERCYVGQGSILSKQFSAIDSLFFANFQGFHGEAVSIFAGPYTVTHHKSTLLIGGMFSFFNAGSGSNQSNHMYKLGPIHYGICDRGTKMASDSYIPWPSRIGSFSVIIGKHKNKVDASSFPFSYVVAEGNQSTIIPGINLQTIGTLRDAFKWPIRDNRKSEILDDNIHFDLFNPYTIQQIISALNTLQAINPSLISDHSSQLHIKASSINRAIDLYEMAISIYLGEAIIYQLKNELPLDKINLSFGQWTDIAGQIIPTEYLNQILILLEGKELESIESLLDVLSEFSKEYATLNWDYACSLIQKKLNKENINKEDLKLILSQWEKAQSEWIKLLIHDAGKEYSEQMKVCYGLNQNSTLKNNEFQIIRGSLDDNNFLKDLQKDFEDKKKITELL